MYMYRPNTDISFSLSLIQTYLSPMQTYLSNSNISPIKTILYSLHTSLMDIFFSLSDSPSLWQVAVDYFLNCPTRGRLAYSVILKYVLFVMVYSIMPKNVF